MVHEKKVSYELKQIRLHLQTHKLQNHFVQHHRKVLLSSFHLNGHTLGFRPHAQTLEPPCTA